MTQDLPAVSLSPVVPALDPRDAVPRLGVILLATDLTFERDAGRLIPHGRAALHATRIPHVNPTTPANLRRMAPRLTEAAGLLTPGATLAAIAYACTAASVEIGDDAVADTIRQARPGVPVVTPPDAAVAAFAALGVSRIALLAPYLVETMAPMVRYFVGRGLEVVGAHCLGMADDRDMARVTPETILEAAEAADRPRAEALFISCTALPALGVVAALETRLGKPVVTSNQATLWRMLHHAGLTPGRDAPGRLFSVQPVEHAA